MLSRVLILSLLALSGADAGCTCYITNAQVNGTKISISNGYNSDDFSACYVPGGCGFIAYSGSETVGWSNITVTFGTKTDTTGQIVIYDGQTNDANKQIATYTTTDSGLKSFSSSTPYIYVLYTQSDSNKPNTYFGNIQAGSSFAAPTTAPPPTTTQPGSNYSTALYAFDPYLISHDTLIMVNQRTSQGKSGLDALNNIASQFVSLLNASVTTSLQGESQTRLGLATVTPYAPNFAAQGEIWGMSAQEVKDALPKAGVSIDVNIINALNGAVEAFFDVNSVSAPTRKNVQRSVILLTAWWNDTQSLDNVKVTFDKFGVNLAVIAVNTSSTALNTTSWYNYVSLSTTSQQDVANIVNRYFFNSGFGNNTLKNNWCKKGSDPVASTTTHGYFMEPSNYGGPKPSSDAWNPTDIGQTARYCNFQDSTYTYNRQDASSTVAFTVYYELKVEQDFLRFYADGVEVESFTGMDVKNAYFEVDANVVTARFTTSNAGVRRGFYVDVTEKKKSP